MRGKLIAAVVCAASLGSAVHAQQPGYPGGYGGLGAYGGYGWGFGFGPGASPWFGYGYNFNSVPYGPYTNVGPYAPNQFNRQSQPLSPYLNLFQSGNPAANYYFRVRPGTTPMAPPRVNPMAMGGGSNMRPPYFPEQYGPDPLADPDQPGRILPPAGHPVVFNNTLGYFPGQGGMGRPRPGVFGVGVPEEAVSMKRFSPTDCRPPTLMKVASWTVPICVGALAPGSVTVTTPSRLIDSEVAFWGTVIAGDSG